MRLTHYISIAAAIGLVAALYWGGNTKPPKTTSTPVATADAPHSQDHNSGSMPAAASTDSLLNAARKSLPDHALTEVKQIEDLIAASASDSAKLVPYFEQLSDLWAKHKEPRMAAYYRAKAGHLAHSEKNLNFAGQIFLDLMHNDAPASVQVWEAQQAIGCFEEALALNPNNDSTKMLLASGYIEGSDNPMQGITLLREIVAKEPNSIPANLMLGRFSIQSGQFDKAVARMETVLKQEPDSREGLYNLAEAYKGLGQKARSIETFERLKKVVNNPDFSRDIDDYIKTFQ